MNKNPGTAWEATFVLSGFEDQPAYSVFCEPEGAEIRVEPGDVVTVKFSGSKLQTFEIGRVPDGIVFWRPIDEVSIEITDKRGRSLSW